MINRRLFLILVVLLGVLWVTVAGIARPVTAQEPTPPANDQPSEPTPTATPALELTTAGWLEAGLLEPADDISALDIDLVDCAVMTAPVVGFEISAGQDSDELDDFFNDLSVNGFSVGAVNITAGPIPACVDVLIVQGSVMAGSLTRAYTAADGALLRAWTGSGHGLLLSGEFDFFGEGTQELFLAYGYSLQGPGAVSDPTDFDSPAPPPASSWVIYQNDNFASHPVLNGVSSIEFLASAWLSPATNAIVTTDTDASPSGAPVMAAFTDGAGCVTLVTDSNWNSNVGTVNGYFKQDNALLARQIITWLDGCTTLNLSKSAGPTPVQAGGLLTYTLTVINNSAATVGGVVITDTVPVSTTFDSATGPFVGPAANGVVTWSLGTLDPATSATVEMIVRVDALAPNGSVVTNTAWLSSDQSLTDTATTITPVDVPFVDLLITKAANAGQAQPGEVVTYTLTVQQVAQSTSNATNVQVVDPLPPEVEILGVEVNAGFTTTAGQVVTWTIPLLLPTDVRLMTVRARVSPNVGPLPLTIQNQATLTFDQGPARLSNLIELLVPAPAPPPNPPPPDPPSPRPTSSPRDNDNDDDDDDRQPTPPPPATSAPATAIARVEPVLPVAFLPDTGHRAVPWSLAAGLAASLTLALIGLIVIVLKVNSRPGR